MSCSRVFTSVFSCVAFPRLLCCLSSPENASFMFFCSKNKCVLLCLLVLVLSCALAFARATLALAAAVLSGGSSVASVSSSGDRCMASWEFAISGRKEAVAMFLK